MGNNETTIHLSREEVATMLEAERQRAVALNDERLIAMYDSVIHYYGKALQQNRSAKNVRMADGSRRWLPKGEAEKLLSLPRKDRV